MSRLLIFSHPLEAVPTISKLEAKERAPGVYAFEGGELVVSGVGLVAATAATVKHLGDHDEVWNLGCAGSLGELKLFEVVEVGSVSQHFVGSERAVAFAREHQPTIELGEGPRLVTVNTTVEQRGLDYDLVDMEGYGVAATGRNVRLIKVISDLASGDPIPPRLERCAEILATRV